MQAGVRNAIAHRQPVSSMIRGAMKTRTILLICLGIMGAMILLAALFPDQVRQILTQPQWYPHVLFVHVLSVTLFFANAVVGMLWEARSLGTRRASVILHTYQTVAWLDARLSAPLIVISVIAGIMLSFVLGGIWSIGWLSVSFLLFLLSGVVWIATDIPAQYRIKRLLAEIDPDASSLPENVLRSLRNRIWVSLAAVVPLLVVFALMVYKPEIAPLVEWFR